MRADMKRPDLGRTPPSGDVPTRSPLSYGDLFHYFDFEVSLRQQLLEPGVFLLELLQALYVGNLHAPERPTRSANRLDAHAVFLGYRHDRALLSLAQHLHLLLFARSTLSLALSGPSRRGSLSHLPWSEISGAGQRPPSSGVKRSASTRARRVPAPDPVFAAALGCSLSPAEVYGFSVNGQ